MSMAVLWTRFIFLWRRREVGVVACECVRGSMHDDANWYSRLMGQESFYVHTRFFSYCVLDFFFCRGGFRSVGEGSVGTEWVLGFTCYLLVAARRRRKGGLDGVDDGGGGGGGSSGAPPPFFCV